MKKLALALLAALALAWPVRADQRSPVYSVTAAPTGTCPYSFPVIYEVSQGADVGKRYACVANAWVELPTGATTSSVSWANVQPSTNGGMGNLYVGAGTVLAPALSSPGTLKANSLTVDPTCSSGFMTAITGTSLVATCRTIATGDLPVGYVDATTDLSINLCTDGQSLVKSGGVWTCGSASASGATATTLGTIRLANDLAGGSDPNNPSISAGAVKPSKLSASTPTSGYVPSKASNDDWTWVAGLFFATPPSSGTTGWIPYVTVAPNAMAGSNNLNYAPATGVVSAPVVAATGQSSPTAVAPEIRLWGQAGGSTFASFIPGSNFAASRSIRVPDVSGYLAQSAASPTTYTTGQYAIWDGNGLLSAGGGSSAVTKQGTMSQNWLAYWYGDGVMSGVASMSVDPANGIITANEFYSPPPSGTGDGGYVELLEASGNNSGNGTKMKLRITGDLTSDQTLYVPINRTNAYALATAVSSLSGGKCVETDQYGNMTTSAAACGVGGVSTGTQYQLAYYNTTSTVASLTSPTSANQVPLSQASGVPVWTDAVAVDPGTSPATGDVIYWDQTAGKYKSLAAGSSGYFLKSQGANTAPIWDTGGSGTVQSGSQYGIAVYTGLTSVAASIADTNAAHTRWVLKANGSNNPLFGVPEMITGTAVDTSTDGLFGLDTTKDQLVAHGSSTDAAYGSTAGDRVFDPRQSLNFTVLSPADGDNPMIGTLPYNVTIRSLKCAVVGSTSIDVKMQHCTTPACTSTTDINSTAATCDVNGVTATVAHSGIAAGEFIRFVLSGKSGTPTQVAIWATYTIDRE